MTSGYLIDLEIETLAAEQKDSVTTCIWEALG